MNVFKSYTKFEDGIVELSNISDIMKNLFTNKEGELVTDIKDCTKLVINKFNEDVDTMLTPSSNMLIGITVNNTSFAYKTEGQLSFGWNINPDKFSFRITVSANPHLAKRSDVMIQAKQLGYKER